MPEGSSGQGDPTSCHFRSHSPPPSCLLSLCSSDWDLAGGLWLQSGFFHMAVAFDMGVDQPGLKTQLNLQKNTELSSGDHNLRWNLISSSMFRREGGNFVDRVDEGRLKDLRMSHQEERMLKGD